MSVLDGRERSADATAIADTEGIEVGRPALMQFLERHPKLALKLIAVLCDKLRKTTELAEDAVFLNVPARLYRRLATLADESGRKDGAAVLIEHRLSQEDLASSIGATRESVNKQLRAWEELGVLEVGRGWIRVRDFAALTAHVEDECGLSLSATP
jgi:CRP-like cAMP-binding protein